MLSPEEAYKYDATFRRVVDLMRAHLSVYEITPSELRQAAILAATMHESQRVKPLFTYHIFRSSGYGYDVCNDCGMSDVYYNWAHSKPKPSEDDLPF